MTKTEKLLSVFAATAKVGGGVHTTAELAFMMGESASGSFTKFLFDCARKGVIRRISKGIYESMLTPPEPSTAIYQIIKKLRGSVLTYISLESQLSYTGAISQVVMDTITIVTKGRSGVFITPYGTIEFTHTKKPVAQIAPFLFFDSTTGMYRATTEQALADLKNCKRNLQMLE